MPLTPNTNATSYLTVTQFLSRADPRVVGDLVSQDGNRVPPAALLTNQVLLSSLSDVSGELESIACRAARYNPADLVAMLTNGGVGAALILRVLTDMCMFSLWKPRMGPFPEEHKSGMRALDALGNGERIFPFAEAQQAGLIGSARIDEWNLLAHRAKRFFGFSQGRGAND